MKRTKGFTLVELLVVVAVVALLVSILLPTLSRAKKLAKQALCGDNLNGVGKGILLYQFESSYALPWIDSSDWSSATGTNAESTLAPTKVSPTALMFMIIRSGQPADIFRCPSDDNAAKMASTRFTSGGKSYYYWDFYDDTKGATAADHCKKVSYSFQAPLNDGAGNYSTGITDKGGLAIMADKTPDFDGKTPCTNWGGNLSKKQRKAGMSQNHDSGDFINVLYADYHVKGSKRADVGIGDDNIYSASNNAGGGTQGAGSTTLNHHLSVYDSFLIGPIK